MRFAKLFLVFGVPLLATVALFLHPSKAGGPSGVEWLALPPMLLVNAIYIGVPQIVFFFVGWAVPFRTPVLLGGLIALDLWLLAFEWFFFHVANQDGDSIGWLIYWALCLPILLIGVLVGWAVKAWRASLRDGTTV